MVVTLISVLLSGLFLGLVASVIALRIRCNNMEKGILEQKDKYSKLLSQKKSSEIKLGKIGEHFAPFTKEWPWDHSGFTFLCREVDGIQFNEDEIVFVEIKTGAARLTKKQRQIRDAVLNNKVRFATFRIDEEGCKVEYASKKKEKVKAKSQTRQPKNRH